MTPRKDIETLEYFNRQGLGSAYLEGKMAFEQMIQGNEEKIQNRNIATCTNRFEPSPGNKMADAKTHEDESPGL